jgi:acetoacetyl-CoA synthetase
LLACASIGAVWSVCAPDTGAPAVLERFRQIEPAVLIAVDGVHYAGRGMDRSDVVLKLRRELPSVRRLIVLSSPDASGTAALDAADVTVAEILRRDEHGLDAFEPEWLPFDHPLWIVYSSGTTGPPKPIVHGHGGIVMTTLASGLQSDLGASYEANSWGERFHWYTSTGWIVWNGQVGGLSRGTTICLYDGSPSGPRERPDWGTLWRFGARHGVTYFGAGAAFYGNCMKAGLELSACGDLSRIRVLGSTGSPLPEDVQRWGSAQFKRLGTPDIWWWNVSGGTDFCGAFTAGHRDLPQVPGRMQCRQLGSAVEAWDHAGQAVVGTVGELVCTRPLPSMPLYFWGDTDHRRYTASYFDVYPGIWRHGDWLQVFEDGTCVIYGRSDATINRHGVRMGSSEIYAAVEALPEVLDSMVVDLEYLGRPSWMVLFLVLRDGIALDDELRRRVGDAIRRTVSPRFVPDAILQAPEIPRTLSGKKQEVPIKKLLLGEPIERVLKPEAMSNPHCLDFYMQVARERAAQH